MNLLSGSESQIIGFDGSRLSGRARTGTESYAFELLKRLADVIDQGELLVYLNAQEAPDDLPAGVAAKAIPASRLWTHLRLSWEMNRKPPGMLFVPSHVVPAIHPRSVVTIHDLAYLACPDAFSGRERRELDLATRWNIKAATKIIAVSRKTKADLVERYNVEPARILVIHHGVDHRFRPVEAHVVDRVRKAFGLERTYILSVGTLHPRKNLERLLHSFEIAVGQGVQHDLVICGTQGRGSDLILRRIASSPMADRIHFHDYVTAEDLPALYSGSELFILPSLYEGFGMTALEAMACGTPVLASSTGALPEICGSAARFFSPDSPASMAEAIVEAAANPETFLRQAELGRVWCRRFTWERSASLTLRVLRAVRDGADVNDDALGWSDFAHGRPGGRESDKGET